MDRARQHDGEGAHLITMTESATSWNDPATPPEPGGGLQILLADGRTMAGRWDGASWWGRGVIQFPVGWLPLPTHYNLTYHPGADPEPPAGPES